MDPDISPQQRREHADPSEKYNAVPRSMLASVVALVVFGIGYITVQDIDQPGSWGDGRSAAELSGARPPGGTAISGSGLFSSLCAACHQPSGQGLAGVFPPLAGSEWVNGSPSTAAAIVLFGVTGPISVAGKEFNGAMPPFKDQLDDAQLAALLTYVRAQWGNSAAPVTAEEVAQARERHKERTTPFVAAKDLPPPSP